VDRADRGEDGSVAITLRFQKARDPFAQKIKRQVEELMKATFPENEAMVIIREAAPKPRRQENITTTTDICRIVAVASGKGGVGKSTVTANLAVALRQRGCNVGILDADIYGPSQNKMFGVEGYIPDAERDEEGHDFIIPAQSLGIKIMSIGFFIKPTDALMWRGGMAVNALHQLIHQTRWGKLDYLLIDLPPGTGDIHLSIINELKISGAVIVSTPQQVAVADVVRGVEMFRHPQVNVPVLGVVENMAWFTPEELPDNKYYLFGKGGAKQYAEGAGVDLLGQIPIIQSIMEGSDEGRPAGGFDPRVEKYYAEIAAKVVEKLPAEC
jgi:ATP-binding protein involved in chromosome partitioning